MELTAEASGVVRAKGGQCWGLALPARVVEKLL